ncbi:Putative membrane protein insertion efficiency factor [Alphaproteobacteria bacterium SO-S41]|nr:Putative membrane protein insertion efficiency factor [Alphaproteobacteria bacterium SO-S41]
MPDAAKTTTMRRWTRAIASAPIRAYKYVISPWLPQACRFEPTCSRYALEAIETHGAIKGLWLGIRRILRCHPITWLGGGAGYDPVPPARPHRHAAHDCAGHP